MEISYIKSLKPLVYIKNRQLRKGLTDGKKHEKLQNCKDWKKKIQKKEGFYKKKANILGVEANSTYMKNFIGGSL